MHLEGQLHTRMAPTPSVKVSSIPVPSVHTECESSVNAKSIPTPDPLGGAQNGIHTECLEAYQARFWD